MEKNWTREAIVDLIIAVERKIEPRKYQLDGILVWPWVRVKLFFFLLRTLERVELDKAPPESTSFSTKAALLMRSAKLWWNFSRIRKKEILFVGAASHRASLSQVSYNKFFDPFRDDSVVAERSVLFEYSKSSTNAFLSERNYSFTDLMIAAGIFYREKKNENSFWTEITAGIAPVLKEHGLDHIDLIKFQKRLSGMWSRVLSYTRLWEKILDRVSPKSIITLCYYSDAVYALNVAASRRGITTIEMQHGPINKYHLAYGSYAHMPELSDSALLPKQFFVWDKSSWQPLQESFPNKKSFIVGQPWIDFIDKKHPAQVKTSKNIVFALQPVSEIGDQFPPFMMNWIKQSSSEYQWRLRLHPRQFAERPQIEAQLRERLPGIQFDIDKASSDPLPVVLRNADLVITNYSGVVIEAGFMGVPSIAVHAIARLYFMNEHRARLTYLCDDDDLTLSWQNIRDKALTHIQSQVDSRADSVRVFKEIVNL